MTQIIITFPLEDVWPLLKPILCVAMFLVGGALLIFIAAIVEDGLDEKKEGEDKNSVASVPSCEKNRTHNEL